MPNCEKHSGASNSKACTSYVVLSTAVELSLDFTVLYSKTVLLDPRTMINVSSAPLHKTLTKGKYTRLLCKFGHMFRFQNKTLPNTLSFLTKTFGIAENKFEWQASKRNKSFTIVTTVIVAVLQHSIL